MTAAFAERSCEDWASAPIRISSFCTGGDCVGVRVAGDIEVVDTKTGDGPALWFTRDEWAAFVAGVKAGEFDLE